MKHLFAIVLTAGCAIGGAAASAQVPPRAPDVEVRIPAPQPVPPGPVIDGPATQGAPTGVTPPPLNTFSDRMIQYLNQCYALACAKEN